MVESRGRQHRRVRLPARCPQPASHLLPSVRKENAAPIINVCRRKKGGLSRSISAPLLRRPKECEMERTFVMVKPDGVRRGLVGEIIRRFEARGLTIAELKLIRARRSLAEEHYGVHRDKPFFQGVVDFITSGPVVAMILEGENAVTAVRQIMGATRPLEAAPGTLRADYCLDIQENLVHGSGSAETASQEIRLWFGQG